MRWQHGRNPPVGQADMNDIELKSWATAALIAGPWFFFRGFRDLRLHRLIQNTPTSRIRSMAMGLVEVCGNVLQRSSVRAPFSNQPCAYWEVEIALRGSEKHGWHTVYRESSGQPFFVDDGTGIAMVYPKGSMCRVPPTADEACIGAMLPDVYSEFLAGRRLWQRFLWRFSQMRFRERRVEEGEKVYILGSAEPRPQSRDISHVEMSDRPLAAAMAVANEPLELQATGTDGPGEMPPAVKPQTGFRKPVGSGDVVSATPPAPGRDEALAGSVISVGAYRQAGPAALMAGAAYDVFQARRRAAPAALSSARVRELQQKVVAVIRRGRNDPTFLIARESEESLTLTLGLLTFAKLIGGPLMTVFGLLYWLTVLAPVLGAR
jgi:hypothetical protein